METNKTSKQTAEARIELYGRVQGIFLRDNIKNYADGKGIKGKVENRKDGSVLLIVQSSREKIDELVSWLKTSPGLSKIIDLKINFVKPEKKYLDFAVVREKGFFSDKSRAVLNLGKRVFGAQQEKDKIPAHVVIIPDGNRRWAREKGMKAVAGHLKAGQEDNVKSLIGEAKNLGVKYLSLWAFSTENWNRNPNEIKAILDLITGIVRKLGKEAHENKFRIRHIGRKDRLPKNLASELKKLEEETKDCNELNIQLCLDYGGRDEMTRAVNKILKSGKKSISEKEFPEFLDSAGIPDPDMIIRTSGEKRLSGFMPFQSDYAELYFIEKFFPDFKAEDLKEAVKDYGRRQRRIGA